MNLSKHLTLDQATKSLTASLRGIPNTPNTEEKKNLSLWGSKIYDPIVEKFGPLHLTSVFRSKKLNFAIKGSPTSAHVKGLAGDIDGDSKGLDNNVLFDWIRENLEYDQLIAEFEEQGRPRWVHVSIRPSGNRQQILIATKNREGKTYYINYTPENYLRTYVYKRSLSPKSKITRRASIPTVNWETQVDEYVDESLL